MSIRTPRPRPRRPAWNVGDLLLVGRTRWVIRVITRQEVELESMNIANASIWWTTNLNALPEKTA